MAKQHDSARAQGQISRQTAGVWYAVAAFLLWGILPLYWKALTSVPAFRSCRTGSFGPLCLWEF